MRTHTFAFTLFAVALSILFAPASARAQLDPLLFLKTQNVNVVLAVETNARMQRECAAVDANGQCIRTSYLDPIEYNTNTSLRAALGLPVSSQTHRRRYVGMEYATSGRETFRTGHIEAVDGRDPKIGNFYDRSRLVVARRAISQAIRENIELARYSFIKIRQDDPGLPSSSGNENTTICGASCGDAHPLGAAQQLVSDSSPAGTWLLTRSRLSKGNEARKATSNTDMYTSGGMSDPLYIVRAEDTGASNTILTRLSGNFWTGDTNALVPAGLDTNSFVDAPMHSLLEDARVEARRLLAADSSGCRNTVVVLVASGADGSNRDLSAKAREFVNLSGGRSAPIYVVAIVPSPADALKLRAVATNSGGEYFEVTKAMIDAAPAGKAVPDVVRGITRAIQAAYAPNLMTQEHQTTSPITGTVNLKGAQYYRPDTGQLATLPDSETEILAGTGDVLPQRFNVMVTSGFQIPSFDGVMRAVRVYKPVRDTTQSVGYKFVQDGSRLWVGRAPSSAVRNIYTVLPGSSSLVKLDASNADALRPYLRIEGDTDSEARENTVTFINWFRARPLGAIINSTPAFLDPPSLDPPPDADYPAFRDENKGRRTLIFVGANDGMLHAIDGRTGVEVWAFVPFNLLPKLTTLQSGQSVEGFKYFVDGSPKVADVKLGNDWRTILVFGQGRGGTFYNALDVTLDDMSGTVSSTADVSAVLTYFSSPDRIQRKWSFPRNSSFDTSLVDPDRGLYGDIANNAPAVEKTVGETWSVPAIGQVGSETGPYVVMVGSGFLKASLENNQNRKGVRAGTSFYVLDAETGAVLATKDVGSDGIAEDMDDCRLVKDCSRMKNALQMDPVAAGRGDSRLIKKAYMGDLDGRLWRFDFNTDGTGISLATPVRLYDAGATQPMFSSMATVNVVGIPHIFVGTGSDALPWVGVNTEYRLLVLVDNGGSASKQAEILLEKTDGTNGDERVTAFPAVAGDIVFFTTTTMFPAQSCSTFYAQLYAFTFRGGPAYDTNNDGTFTGDDSSTRTSNSASKRNGGSTATDDVLVASIAGARATAPFIVDQHLAFSVGGKIQLFGDPEDFNNGVGDASVRILSWRLVK